MANEPRPCLFDEEPNREGAGDPPVKAQARGAGAAAEPGEDRMATVRSGVAAAARPSGADSLGLRGTVGLKRVVCRH